MGAVLWGGLKTKKARGADPVSDSSSRLLVISAEYLLHLAGDDGNGVAGDDQLLVGRHDDHLDLTVRGGSTSTYSP